MAGDLSTRRFVVLLSIVVILGFSGPKARAELGVERSGSRSTCWLGPVPEEVDPCGLLEQAAGLLGRLSGSARRSIQELGTGLDIERNLEVQERLLREHLAWQDEDLTERQLDLIVFLAVASSINRAEKRAVELYDRLDNQPDPESEGSLQNIELYREQALTLLSTLSPRLRNLSDRELSVRL